MDVFRTTPPEKRPPIAAVVKYLGSRKRLLAHGSGDNCGDYLIIMFCFGGLAVEDDAWRSYIIFRLNVEPPLAKFLLGSTNLPYSVGHSRNFSTGELHGFQNGLSYLYYRFRHHLNRSL